MNQSRYSLEEAKKFKILLAIFVTAMIIIMYSLVYISNDVILEKIQDPPNLISLIIEIGIGIIISVIVYTYSDMQQKKMTTLMTKTMEQQNEISKLVSRINDIEEKQVKTLDFLAKSLKEKQKHVGGSLALHLNNLIVLLDRVDELYQKFQQQQDPIKKQSMFNSLLSYTQRAFYTLNLNIQPLEVTEIFGMVISNQYNTLIHKCSFDRTLFDYDETGKELMIHFKDIREKSEELKKSLEEFLTKESSN